MNSLITDFPFYQPVTLFKCNHSSVEVWDHLWKPRKPRKLKSFLKGYLAAMKRLSLQQRSKKMLSTFELHLRSNTVKNKLQEKLLNMHECSLLFYLSILPLSIFSSMLYLILIIQTGVPPDDSSLCDFQAWLLSFTGMWLSFNWQ